MRSNVRLGFRSGIGSSKLTGAARTEVNPIYIPLGCGFHPAGGAT